MTDETAAGQPDATASDGVRVVYCHCAFAKVVPEATKAEVLRRLSESDIGFDAVPDLCEMSARHDPALRRLASGGDEGELKIAACFPRAVKWLFHAGGAPLQDDRVEVVNMRELDAAAVTAKLLGNAAPTESREAAS